MRHELTQLYIFQSMATKDTIAIIMAVSGVCVTQRGWEQLE